METNDTRSVISTLPQQTVFIPDEETLEPTSQGQQLMGEAAPVRNASTTAVLLEKLGGTLSTAVSATKPGNVLPLQAAQPYGNTSAGGALSQALTGQPQFLSHSM